MVRLIVEMRETHPIFLGKQLIGEVIGLEEVSD